MAIQAEPARQRDWRFGPTVTPRGVTFRLWAPAQTAVSLRLDDGDEQPLTRHDDGFFERYVEGARPGQRYWFRNAQGLRPDPASRFQPDGPLGPSSIVDLTYAWKDEAWTGIRELHRQVIYEMHIGTFTREGTWAAAARHLPRLADLGITTLEVMPIAEFAGRFGWGYDGVHLFAPTRLYGEPRDVQAFVEQAHLHGLGVILDVVYNHLGPVGNFLPEFTPTFTGRRGEWGDLVNFDGPGSREVRQFVLENAGYWVEAFRFDGFRLDATQAIVDESPEHIISEIAAVTRRAASNRGVFIVGESEPQDTRLLKAAGVYPDGLDAIWNEDWHHAAAVCATGRRPAYYTDYQGTAPEFASMARFNTLYQGQWYSWQQRPRGGWAIGLPASAFVCFLENHDQVANTGIGARLHQLTGAARWRALTSLLLLGPALPQLFQGQEFGSTQPFTYFADHDGDLAGAVRAGRLQFLSQFAALATPEMQQHLPDPGDIEAFHRAALNETERAADGPLARLHRDLIRLRRDDPVLAGLGTAAVRVESAAPAEHVLVLRYMADCGHRLLLVNIGADHRSSMNEPLLAPAPGTQWSIAWSSEDPKYGGGTAAPFVEAGCWMLPGETAVLLSGRATEDGRRSVRAPS